MSKQDKQKKFDKFFSLVLCCVMALGFFPISAHAAEEESKVVRIGWYQSELFQEGMSDEAYKSGYSYDYIHHIANYCGWQYEYVYGEWADLFPMLESGEIDVLAGVSKTEERMECILYPQEIMGNERYVLYQHSAGGTIDELDISTFTNKKIGAIRNNLMTTCLENWLSENGAEAEIVYYNGFEERDQDFADGIIDAIVATDNNILLADGYDKIVTVGEEAYYLAVAMSRSDLLDDLNRAQGYIREIDPYYLTNLEYQSYGTTLANSTLSDIEEAWVDAHSVLSVGYLENYMPYCGTDEAGNVTGLITDVMDGILKELHIADRLSVSYLGFANGDEMNEALKSGQIDAAFPVGGEIWQLEQYGIKASNDLVTSNVNLVYRGSVEDIRQVAVTAGNTMMRDYLKTTYPDAEITEYESITACLEAVLSGDADATTINSLRIDIVKKNRDYDSLSLMRLSRASGRCLGVSADNTGLLMLLNRGIKLIGADFASNASYNYMSELYQVTVADFIVGHLGLAIGVVALIILIIILAAIKLQNNTKVFLKREEKKNRELQENQARLEEATAEQEAHIEEITALNAELQELTVAANEANRSKTDFLNNMSHDIRTPMNAIVGYTELLARKKDDPELVADYIGKIKVSAEYLLSIINNILDMAIIESGKLTMDESVVDLLAEESSVFSSVSVMAKAKNQTVTTQKNVQHRYVLCDVAKQREILMNLLSNAVKYTPEGGTIQMKLEELPCERTGYGTYRMMVADDGIGMSPEFQKQIFETFTRERNTTESKVLGTGLGMAIVKKLVDFLGGTIEVESELGKGTVFTVTLDYKIMDRPDEPQTGRAVNAAEEGVPAGKRVLLAEDNDLNAEIAIAVLEDIGLIVERAADGIECVEKLLSMEPKYYDLILMDIQMPNLNGYEATKRIRAISDPVRSSIPIIAMTANAFEDDKKYALAAGMNGHLAKPIDISKLKEMLARMLKE